jgi:O-6-methylguanine DNA methyltransferase
MTSSLSRSPGISVLDLRTTWGVVRVAALRGRLLFCRLPRRDEAGVPFRITGRSLRAGSRGDREVLEDAASFAAACFRGERRRSPPTDLRGCTPFEAKVWGALRRIPPGRTASYREIAKSVGRPKAARAVGSACGRNPLPLFIPCHRVVGAGGGPGGFSCGLAWKKLLLSTESAARRGVPRT